MQVVRNSITTSYDYCREIYDGIQDELEDKETWDLIELIARISLVAPALLLPFATLVICCFIPNTVWIVAPIGIVATLALLVTLAFTFVVIKPQIDYPK